MEANTPHRFTASSNIKKLLEIQDRKGGQLTKSFPCLDNGGHYILTLFQVATALGTTENLVINNERRLKVFVGTCARSESFSTYKNERINVLEKLVSSKNNETMDAVVVFNKFLSPNDISSIAKRSDVKIKSIWVGLPNVQCTGGAAVFNNNVQAALDFWAKDLIESMNLEGFSEDKNMVEMSEGAKKGSVKIYAVLVSAPLSTLNLINKEPNVEFVDLHYHAEAEAIAQEKGYEIVYIDVPERPDSIDD